MTTALRALLIAGIAVLPVALFAFPSNPPLALSGAPGEGTCASCHGTLTAGTGVTVTFPSGTTYTPGGPAIPLTVAVTSGSGGFELSSRVSSDNSQAGSLAAGTASGVSTQGGIQYAFQTARATSWTIQWTPPATNVGNVAIYVAGVGPVFGATFSNSYTLTPAVATPTTLSLSSSALTFDVNGSTPAPQTVQVTSSGAPIAFTTSVATTSGGSWLVATPPGGNTPLGVSVSVNAAGLSAGQYMGTVTVTAPSASNSPLTVAVTLNVNATPPPVQPNISLSSSALTFSATTGGTAAPQNVQVTSTGTPITFTAAATTTSGGNWLTAGAGGTTPATLPVSVSTAGLAVGTYMGSVTFTSPDAANSPLTLPVTLRITSPQPPPPTGALSFSFNVVDSQTGGTDRLLLSGRGSVDGSGQVTGSGRFTRYAAGGGKSDDRNRTVSSGSWTADSVVSFTPIPNSRSGGVLVLGVTIKTSGGTSSTGTMTITSKGDMSGVQLSIDGGATFVPTDIGSVSIRLASGGGRGDDSSDDHSDESDN